jgi:hypothetical protein
VLATALARGGAGGWCTCHAAGGCRKVIIEYNGTQAGRRAKLSTGYRQAMLAQDEAGEKRRRQRRHLRHARPRTLEGLITKRQHHSSYDTGNSRDMLLRR